MTNPNFTYLLGVIDRSGSMHRIADDTAGGWNTLVKEQAKQPGSCKVTLVEFDDQIDTVYQNVDATRAPEYVLISRGSTALRDAIGRSVTDLGIQLATLNEEDRPSLVTVAILTDGLENASREWTVDALKELITRQTEEYSWVFQFMGANQDAILTAGSMGISPGYALTYNTENVNDAFLASSSNFSSLRSYVGSGVPVATAAAKTTYTDDQRNAVTEVKPQKRNTKLP